MSTPRALRVGQLGRVIMWTRVTAFRVALEGVDGQDNRAGEFKGDGGNNWLSGRWKRQKCCCLNRVHNL
jgi:hypothetical protein